MEYRKGVFIVTYKKENDNLKYLLLKRKLHWKGWEFPKGGFEKGTILANVKREIKEETGNIAKNIINHKLKGKYKYKKEIKGRKEKGQTYSLYSCEIKNKKVKLDKHEHSDYKFVNYKQAIKLLTWSNQRKCLRIVNRSLKNK
tara:strand:- start:286 stop:714 length:429 start_codon:yes stop_codon:yes gene_type:complete